MLVPTVVVAAAVSWGAGASTGAAILALAASVVVSVVAFSGELGEVFAQGSAYGHERRLPLRPPAALMIVLPIMWAALTAAVLDTTASPALSSINEDIADASNTGTLVSDLVVNGSITDIDVSPAPEAIAVTSVRLRK